MRFVIQHHINENDHYDLMIETQSMDSLLSFRLSIAGLDALREGSPAKAERIKDHRKDYLEYEGPVSGGRGSVVIYDKGECETVLKTDDRFGFKIYGRELGGGIIIKKIEGSLFEILYTRFL